MGKVVIQEFLTVDGVVEDPGGETDFEHGGWAIPFVDDDQLRWIVEQAQATEALLLGRRTYEGFVAAWPDRTGPLANRLNELPKHVATTTLDELEWNSSPIDGDVPATVAQLAQAADGDLTVHGSVTLAKSLMRAGVVDEYHLWIVPVALGSGERLFDESIGGVQLALTDVKRTGSGQAVLTYARG
jgi:dihydrofolate reductase